MLRLAGVMAALVLAAAPMTASADVSGQEFAVGYTTTEGDFHGRILFNNFVIVGIDVEDAGDATGLYAQPIDMGFVSLVTCGALSGDDAYLAAFAAVSVDSKQLPGILGAIATFLGRPARIVGVGATTVPSLVFFSGEQINF